MEKDLFNLKSLIRRRRQFDREVKKIDQELQKLILKFNEVYSSYNWNENDPFNKIKKINLIDEYTWKWIRFANRWNSNKKHVTNVDHLAFGSNCDQKESFLRQFTPFDEKTEEIPELIISKFEKQ